MNTLPLVALITSFLIAGQALANGACQVRRSGDVAECQLPAGETGTYLCKSYYPAEQSFFAKLNQGMRMEVVGSFQQRVSHDAMREVLRMKTHERARTLLEGGNATLSALTSVAHQQCEAALRKRRDERARNQRERDAAIQFDPKKCEVVCNGVAL